MTPEMFRIFDYKLNNGKLDVFQDVYLGHRNLKEIPFNFGTIHGNFILIYNSLENLLGAPNEVRGDFSCSANKLKSLKGCPSKVHGNFYCSNNELISLEYCPEKITGVFCCQYNKLNSLKYCPKDLGIFINPSKIICHKVWNNLSFNCSNNNISTINYLPNIIPGKFIIRNNPIKEIKHLPKCNELITNLSNDQIDEMIRIGSNKTNIRLKMNQL